MLGVSCFLPPGRKFAKKNACQQKTRVSVCFRVASGGRPERNVRVQLEQREMLPRTVFQYWEQGAPLALCLESVVDANRRLNPGWRFRLLSAADAPSILAAAELRGVPRLAEAFSCIRHEFPQARSDVLRYAAVLLNGGVYLDIKSAVLRPLDEIFCHERQEAMQVWDHAIGPNGLVSWGFAAPANHPRLIDILSAIRDNLLADQRAWPTLVGKRASVNLVGPAMLSRTLRWDPKARRCRADGVLSISGRNLSRLIEYDGTRATPGCYYGNGSAARRVRYELVRSSLTHCSPPRRINDGGDAPARKGQRSAPAAVLRT